jgi:hypothetical protein
MGDGETPPRHSVRVHSRVSADEGPIVLELSCSCGNFGPWSFTDPTAARRNFANHFAEASYPVPTFGFEDAFDRRYPQMITGAWENRDHEHDS